MAEGTRWSQTLVGLSTGSTGSNVVLSSIAFYPTWFTDPVQNPFNIGIGITSVSTNVCNAEVTFDYTGSSAFISSNATWMPLSGLTSVSGNNTGNIAFPVTAVRLNCTAGTSNLSVTMTVIQAGV